MHVGADHGAVFVGPVVVRDDTAGTEIHALADAGVADVGEVIRLRAASQVGVLHLDEVADVHVLTQ